MQRDIEGLLKELSSRYPADTFIKALFSRQNDFINDPSKRKAAICSRRAGKSHMGGAYLTREAIANSEGDVAYIGLTRGAAKKIMFQPLERLNKRYNMGLEFNRSDLTATAPNGNTIYMTGAHTEDDTEKLRGLKFKLILLDECASFKAHLNYLIEEVLEPTLIDTDGTLALIGTPSANPGANYFHKATTDITEGFSVHRWTILDNPFIPHAAQWLEKYRERKKWTEEHPIYRREWLGEWTTDADTLVYKYRKEKNDYEALPNSNFRHVMGVDLGFNDAFTICVIAYCDERRECFIVDQFKKSGLIPAGMAAEIQSRIDIYKPQSIVGDYGGLGKAICEEFRVRYHIPIKPAEKSQKLTYIELANGDLFSGLVKIKDGSPLANEMTMLQWDVDHPGKEDPRTQNDLCDSFLYAYRETKHYLGVERGTPPEPETPAYHEREAKRMFERETEEFEKGPDQEWWAQ